MAAYVPKTVESIAIAFDSPGGTDTYTLTKVLDVVGLKEWGGYRWPYVIYFLPGATICPGQDDATGYSNRSTSEYEYGEVKANQTYVIEDILPEFDGGILGSFVLVPHNVGIGSSVELDGDTVLIHDYAVEAPAPATPPTTLTATPTNSTVLVNGKSIAFDAYSINDNNYLKLRDLAYILNGTEKQQDKRK